MELSPEESIRVQNKIGADIIMALDDVVKTTTDLSRMSEANDRTLRWINWNFEAHSKPHIQNLFPII